VPALAPNPVVRLKYRYIDKREPIPDAPRAVQIQTVSGCNANCIFCPNKKTELDIPFAKKMDWDLFRSIVDQVADLGVRRISPYLMNESMLDNELPERVAYISKRKQPFQFTKINTHGGLLTERMAKGLLDAGLDRLNFSVQGIDPVVYEKIMGIKFDKVLRNIERFMEFVREGDYKIRVRIVMLDTIEIHPHLDEIRAFWKSRGIKINVNQLENRGHHKNIQSDAIAVHQLQNFDWCNRMFEQVYILYDGRLVMCCADWEQTSMMGDLKQHKLHDIWHGEVYTDYRRRFLQGNVKGMICDGCTKDAAGPDDEEYN
jgi:molybdenum cofactor biosynthesis enzyme MoaA